MDDFDEEALEAGRLLFAGPCDFMLGVVAMSGLPAQGLPEIAFAGRSNVGKSSLINALTGRTTLARTSNTPGRTQEINYFRLGAEPGAAFLVDLPGYGYAKVSRDRVKAWSGLVRSYLKGRPSLRRVLLLIDARHGLKDSDRTIMKMLDDAAVSYQVVLTKMDKLTAAERAGIVESVEAAARGFIACHPRIHATSAVKQQGIAELRAEIAALAQA